MKPGWYDRGKDAQGQRLFQSKTVVLQPKEDKEFSIRSQEMCAARIELEPRERGMPSMELRTLDVRTAEGTRSRSASSRDAGLQRGPCRARHGDASQPGRAAAAQRGFARPRPGAFSALRRLASASQEALRRSPRRGGVPRVCGNAVLVAAPARGPRPARARRRDLGHQRAERSSAGAGPAARRRLGMLEILRSLGARGVADIDWLAASRRRLLLRPFGARLPDALLRGRRSHQAMLAGLAVETFEECEIPFRCIACTDDETGAARSSARARSRPRSAPA